MKGKFDFYDFLDEVRAQPLTPMQYLTLMNKVRVYFEYRRILEVTDTPERTALARWSMQDAEAEYLKFCRSLGIKPPSLYLLRKHVY